MRIAARGTLVVAVIVATLFVSSDLRSPSHASAAGRHPVLIGAWTAQVTPEPASEFPEPPPPFTALFSFDVGQTVKESDTVNNPNSNRVLFPEVGPFNSGDGMGAWEASGWNTFDCKIIKMLFSPDGQHLGYTVTRLKVTLSGWNAFEATGASDFVFGPDPDGEPIFSGPLRIRGSRLSAQ